MKPDLLKLVSVITALYWQTEFFYQRRLAWKFSFQCLKVIEVEVFDLKILINENTLGTQKITV